MLVTPQCIYTLLMVDIPNQKALSTVSSAAIYLFPDIAD